MQTSPPFCEITEEQERATGPGQRTLMEEVGLCLALLQAS